MKSKIKDDLELTPNCLITQHPLVFGSGAQSLFFSQRYWHYFPEFLAEHGYPVYHFFFPDHINKFTQQKLKDHFDERVRAGQKWHLIVDEFRYEEMLHWGLNQHPLISTLTVLSEGKTSHPLPLNQHSEKILSCKELIPAEKDPTVYQMHLLFKRKKAPSAHLVGLMKSSQKALSNALLQRAVELAESDFVMIETETIKYKN